MRRRAGTLRMGRCYSQYANCPLPTLEDRLLLLLIYLKQVPTQVVHGAAFGMGQSKANPVCTRMRAQALAILTRWPLPSRPGNT